MSEPVDFSKGEWITFEDFEQVLRDYMSERDARDLFGRSLGITINSVDGALMFWRQDGTPVDRRLVHELIQAEPAMRQKMYRYAMSNWR